MRNSFDRTTGEVKKIVDQATLLRVVNGHKAEDLLPYGVAELGEYEGEMNKYGTPDFSPIDASDELHDTGVCVITYGLMRLPDLVNPDPIGRVNGYGKRSDSLERLSEVILDVLDDPRAFPEVIARIYSIANYAPHPGTGLEFMDETAKKVLKNRHPYLYNIYCPFKKRNLNKEEAILKYGHLETCTRMIRKHVGRTLEVSDWWPFRMLLLDWINSTRNIALLKDILAKDPQNQDEIVVFERLH